MEDAVSKYVKTLEPIPASQEATWKFFIIYQKVGLGESYTTHPQRSGYSQALQLGIAGKLLGSIPNPLHRFRTRWRISASRGSLQSQLHGLFFAPLRILKFECETVQIQSFTLKGFKNNNIRFHPDFSRVLSALVNARSYTSLPQIYTHEIVLWGGEGRSRAVENMIRDTITAFAKIGGHVMSELHHTTDFS